MFAETKLEHWSQYSVASERVSSLLILWLQDSLLSGPSFSFAYLLRTPYA